MDSDEFLDSYLSKLEIHYDHENLVGLPESQLAKEISYVNEHINRLAAFFPGLEESDIEPALIEWITDKEFSFDPLTKEQVTEINLVVQQIERNINRAIHEEQIRRQERRGKIGQLIVSLIDACTPGSRQEVSVKLPNMKKE